MTMNYVSNDLIEQAELRNKLIDRVDVLNKVKELFLIPKLEMMSIGQVAEFYEVSPSTINTLYLNNIDEINIDGVVNRKAKDLKELWLAENMQPKVDYEIIKGARGRTTFSFNGKVFEVNNYGSKFFTPRAVLRIGMLLRDSEVAKEVRTQLLNTFEHTTVEQKLEDIDEEILLLAKAIASKNKDDFYERLNDYTLYMNRRVDLAEQRASELELQNADLQEFNSNLQQTNTALMGANIGLKAENTNLNTELDVAFNRFSTWESPKIVRRLITAMGSTSKEYGSAWGQLYSNLRFHYGICLKNRKCKPNETVFSTIKPDEWDKVLAECWVMARRRGIDIAKLLGKENAAIMEQYASLAPEII